MQRIPKAINKKRLVRYKEGAEMYSMGMNKFQTLAKDAGAILKIDRMVLVDLDVFDQYLESFRVKQVVGVLRKIFRITKNVLTFGLTESIMNMKWMEVYAVARTGRPKSENPKKTLIGLKLTEEEAAKLREYASKHDMTITQVLQKGIDLQYAMEKPLSSQYEISFLEKGDEMAKSRKDNKGRVLRKGETQRSCDGKYVYKIGRAHV